MTPVQAAWFDANLVAALLAINPRGLKGVRVKGQFGPVRDAWLTLLVDLITPQASLLKAPSNLMAEQLLGSLDIEKTLNQGFIAKSKGLLERAQKNYLLLAMAERMDIQALALISQALDQGDFLSNQNLAGETHFGVIAFDESEGADDGLSFRMMDRLAFEIYLDQISIADAKDNLNIGSEDIRLAKELLPQVVCSADFIEVLAKAAINLGVGSLRANQFAIQTAKTLAALRGLVEVGQDEVIDAARLVYTHSKILHLPPESEQMSPDSENETSDTDPNHDQENGETTGEQEGEHDKDKESDTPSLEELKDIVVAATRASIPRDLIRQSKQSLRSNKSISHVSGKSGESQNSFLNGKPIASQKGKPGNGRRLDILRSIRSAIPWQSIRGARSKPRLPLASKNVIDFRVEDLYVKQYLKKRGTVTIFLVDASGSSATQRLAEAKGALEQLLAQCYIRRDEVSMISMRGSKAELILPPTRSLVRAKRDLAGLPGGGGTPLATGFKLANEMALVLKRKGVTPIIVILSDGKANVNLKGVGGRAGAHIDALITAKELRVNGHQVLFVDTSPQPEALAQELSQTMGAQYLALPYSGSGKTISQAAMRLAEV